MVMKSKNNDTSTTTSTSSSSVSHCCLFLQSSESSSSSTCALALLLLSAILFSVAGIFVKLAAETGMSSSEMVMIRAVFQGIFVVLGLCCWRGNTTTNDNEQYHCEHDELLEAHDDDDDCQDQRHPVQNHQNPPRQHEKKQQQGQRLIWQPFGATRDVQKIVALRGMVGAAGFCFYFYTICTLPLGDAVALISLKPVPTVFLACTFLGEGIQCMHIVVTILCVLGSLGIAQPSFLFPTTNDSHPLNDIIDGETSFHTEQQQQQQQPHAASFGHVTGLLGACCAAGVVILIRKAGSVGAHTLQLLFSWSFFSILFSSILLWGQWSLPNTRNAWLYVLLLSILGAVAHFLLNYAARLAPATLSAIVRSSDIMFAYLWEILIFHQVPNLYTWLGVTLIAMSLIVIGVMHNSSDSGNMRSSPLQQQDDDEEQQDEIDKPSQPREDSEACVMDDDEEDDDDDFEVELAEVVVNAQTRGMAGYAKVSAAEF